MAAGKELFKLWGLIGMQGVDTTAQGLKKIDKQVRKSQKELERLGKRAQKVGTVLTKAFTVPLLAIGGLLVKFGADFDQAMAKSTAIMGDLTDEMRKEMRTAAIDVSKVTKASAKEAADAYFFLASAGKNAAQSIGLLPLVAKFAQAGAFDLARATDLLTDAQSALGLSSKDTATDMLNMTRVSDVLVKANTLANATVEQFSESLTNKAGAALRILGKDIEEGAAVLAVYADQGLKGAAAGESLNISMRDLQKANIKNKQAFKDARIAVFDSNGEMRNMADIVGDLEGHLAGMSDEQKKATLMQLGFTEKSINATMALIGTSDAIREYEAQLKKAAGTTNEVAEKQLKNFWSQLGLLKDRLIAVGLTLWEDFGATLNNRILPLLSKFIEKIEKLAAAFNKLDPKTKKTIKGFVLIAAALGPVVFLIGKLIVLSKVFIPLLAAWRAGTTGWALAMKGLSKSVLGITLVVAALVALGWYWYSQWDTMRVQLAALWAKIRLLIVKGVNGMFQAFADGAIKIIETLDLISSVIPGFSNKLKGAKKELLLFKAMMYRDLGKQMAYTNAINSTAKANESFTETLKKAVVEGKKAIGIKEEDIEVTKKQIVINKELEKQRKKDADDELEFQRQRLDFEKGIQDQINELSLSEMERLELERDQKLSIAEQLNADIFAVEKLYDLKIADLEDKLRKEKEKKDKRALKNKLRQTVATGNRINSILGMFSDNQIRRLDIEEQKRIQGIQNSQMTEEQKELAIQKIQDETDKKRRNLERQRAIREKVAALFNIAINTASAVVEALPNIPLALFVGALGLAEGIAVATTPLPFEEGGLVTGSPEGVNALIGEKNQDEIVFPLERGIELFIDGLMERIGEIEFPTFAAPELAAAPGGGSSVHLHVGTLIADKHGLKELERKLDTIRIAENQRKGF